MIKFTFKIPIYEINVTLLQIEGVGDANVIKPTLKKFALDKQYLDYTMEGIVNDSRNGGDTYRDLNTKKRRFLVVFYKMTDAETRREVYEHEKRHIEDRILEYYSINDIEAAGMLSGFLGRMFYRFEQKQKMLI